MKNLNAYTKQQLADMYNDQVGQLQKANTLIRKLYAGRAGKVDALKSEIISLKENLETERQALTKLEAETETAAAELENELFEARAKLPHEMHCNAKGFEGFVTCTCGVEQ